MARSKRNNSHHQFSQRLESCLIRCFVHSIDVESNNKIDCETMK